MSILKRYGTTLRIYDNGGKTFDRYTIIPARWDSQYRENSLLWNGIGSSSDPFHPQGFGMWISAMPGHHLGKRVHIRELPEQTLLFAKQSFPEYFEVTT